MGPLNLSSLGSNDLIIFEDLMMYVDEEQNLKENENNLDEGPNLRETI